MVSVVFAPVSVRVQVKHMSNPFVIKVIFNAASLVIPCSLWSLKTVDVQSFYQGWVMLNEGREFCDFSFLP